MTLALNKVHEYKRINDGSQAVLTNVNPVIRLGHRTEGEDQIYIFIQNGVFYGGERDVIEIEDLPKWALDQIDKLTKRAREEAGLKEWKRPETEADED
jgi:hypothetical protein